MSAHQRTFGRRNVLGALLLAVTGLAIVMVVRAAPREVRHAHEPSSVPPLEIEGTALAARFAAGIRLATISRGEDDPIPRDDTAFLGFHQYLIESYPRIHRRLEREVHGELSLLYTWRGRRPELEPLVLLAHHDVVPVEEGTESEWTHPPFSGRIEDGAIWGRGTLDDKVGVFGLLEAAESLLGQGFEPERTIYFAFGHDEELGGSTGARTMAEVLADRGVKPLLVLDEGGGVVDQKVPGMDAQIAVIGIAEKGYLSVVLEVEGPGGHSSSPRGDTTIGILAHAVAAVEDAPMPIHTDGPLHQTLSAVAPHLPFGYRLMARNLWFFWPAISVAVDRVPQAGTAVRTTTAPTIIQAGIKDNVLPAKGRAVINFRLYPGDTIEDVRHHVVRAIADERVKVSISDKNREASTVSPTDSPGWLLLERSLQDVFPGTVLVPYLIPGGTDARHYRRLTSSAYGFNPVRMSADSARMVHGTDEHVRIDDFVDAVRFYAHLMRLAAGPS